MSEIIVIVVIAMIFLGPKRLPEIASGIGKAIREVRKATADIRQEIELDDAIRKPLEELRDAATLPPEELKRRDEQKKWREKWDKEEAERLAREAAAGSAEGVQEPASNEFMSDLQSHHPVDEAPGSGVAEGERMQEMPLTDSEVQEIVPAVASRYDSLTAGEGATDNPDQTVAMAIPPAMEGAATAAALPPPSRSAALPAPRQPAVPAAASIVGTVPRPASTTAASSPSGPPALGRTAPLTSPDQPDADQKKV